ncbi:MAG TPA: metalloregulator ArsR/SmtB family transcription factor [Phycisphaerae bacterium]|nr:metalloregulator ArsR/SmtB family transcription factor [Phycisphaerae bacterium]
MDGKTKRLYEMKARVLAALAHPIRLAVVDFLRDGEQCVCDIAKHVAAERSNVSRHLGVMVRAGILAHRKDGLRMLYRLKCPCVLEFMSCVTNVLRVQVEDQKAVLRHL